jgi:hypothetical protein
MIGIIYCVSLTAMTALFFYFGFLFGKSKREIEYVTMDTENEGDIYINMTEAVKDAQLESRNKYMETQLRIKLV